MPRMTQPVNEAAIEVLERLKKLAGDLPILVGPKTPILYATAELFQTELDAVIRALRPSDP